MLTQNSDLTYSATIDGKNYRFSQWDAVKSMRTLAELSGVLGEGLNLGKLAVGSDDLSQKLTLASLAAKALLTGLGSDPDRTIRVMTRLCCDGVSRDDRPLRERDFGTDFQGDIMHAFSVSLAALEVHYQRFFQLSAQFLRTLQEAPAKTGSPSTSTS